MIAFDLTCYGDEVNLWIAAYAACIATLVSPGSAPSAREGESAAAAADRAVLELRKRVARTADMGLGGKLSPEEE